MNNIKERIKRLKIGKPENVEGTKERIVVEVSFKDFKSLVDKLETIEIGAEKNIEFGKLKEDLFAGGITAETLQGFSPDDFSFVNHEHKEIPTLLKREEFINYKKDISIDTTKISKSLVDLFYELENIKNTDNTVEIVKDIETIKVKAKEFNKKIKALENKGIVIENDVDMKGYRLINLKDPKEFTDATNKRYVDTIVQRNVSKIPTFLGGDSNYRIPFVGKSPPENPNVNDLWVDIS
jgi:hypothetical protein